MRKASMNFKSGALYTKDGRKLADIDSGIVEWGVQVTAEVPTKIGGNGHQEHNRNY